MAAIEDIVAWCKQEQARLARRLEQLQSGHLRIVEKHAQAPGWLEIDTTAQSIDLYRQYISEFSAIIARYPAVVPTPSVAPPTALQPAALPRVAPPVPDLAAPHVEHGLYRSDMHPDWVNGWGVVKGQPPRWQFAGIYQTHAEADEAAAEAGEGYYARWGSYNENSKEFTSGPQFERL